MAFAEALGYYTRFSKTPTGGDVKSRTVGVVTLNTTLHFGHLKLALPENCFTRRAPHTSFGHRMFIGWPLLTDGVEEAGGV